MKVLAPIVLVLGALAIVGMHINKNTQFMRIESNVRKASPPREGAESGQTKVSSYLDYNSPGALDCPQPLPRAVRRDGGCSGNISYLAEKRKLHYAV